MEWTIKYNPSGRFLYVKTKGVLTREDADAMVGEIAATAERHQCWNQVVDHRETVFALRLFEYYERPGRVEKIGMPRRSKIAMVFRKLTADTQFMETVFRNRGYNLRQFDDLEKARAWVTGK
jgi:hypothetical protein